MSERDTGDKPPVERSRWTAPNARLHEPDMPAKPVEHSPWPYAILPIICGAASGLAVRLIFSGNPGEIFATMGVGFIYGSPVLVAAVTVYVSERIKRRSWWYYFGAAAGANCLFVLGSLAILIEGLICAIVIVPLFSLVGGLAGLVMGAVCRVTNWPKHTLGAAIIIPLALGAQTPSGPPTPHLRTVEHSVLIQAPAKRVWREIHDARDIEPHEVNHALLYRIGVPLPLAGVTRQTPDGPVREITMGKSVHFEQVTTASIANRYVHWKYRFAEDSFPPNAFDQHVVLGGRYFDIEATSYTLTPHAQGTRLSISLRYRVSTQFNWYADPVAHLLMSNFEQVILDFYRKRSEPVCDTDPTLPSAGDCAGRPGNGAPQ